MFILVPSFRFMQLKLTLGPFKDLVHHPGHFSLEVTDTTTIHGLYQVIKAHLEGSAATIAIFKDHTCSRLSYLPPTSCLFHCGKVGGPRTRTVEAELFYDYKPVMNDCPLLMDESHLANISVKKYVSSEKRAVGEKAGYSGQAISHH